MAPVDTKEDVPTPVVTNPEIARGITGLLVCYSVYLITMYAYVVYKHLRIDGPSQEALVYIAVEAPLFLIQLCMIPWLRGIFIGTFAQTLSSDDFDSMGTDDDLYSEKKGVFIGTFAQTSSSDDFDSMGTDDDLYSEKKGVFIGTFAQTPSSDDFDSMGTNNDLHSKKNV